MELVGEEKRIPALFSELRLADEQTMPSFAAVWSRAQPKTIRSVRAFNLSFVAATALLVCALASLALWSRAWEQNQDSVANVPAVPLTTPVLVAKRPEPNPPSREQRHSSSFGSRRLKLAARRQALMLAASKRSTRDAKAITSWQSPTATLLRSPSDEVLTSLPQLNQSVNELRSFLPSRNN